MADKTINTTNQPPVDPHAAWLDELLTNPSAAHPDEAAKETKRQKEVAELLERKGVNPDQVEFKAEPSPEPHPFDELAADDGEPVVHTQLLPDLSTIEESLRNASVNNTAAAAKVVTDLVPNLGKVMATQRPDAIAFGFPPVVDNLIKKAQLTPEQSVDLLDKFRGMFALIENMRARVETIEIHGPEDHAAIAEAKEVHKILRDERLNAEKRKKIIKEPYLRPCQLIDGIFKIFMDEVKPLEVHAKAKAEYIENLEKERKANLAAARLEKLKLFDADGGAFDLGEIDDAAFELIYQGAIASYNARKAEEERIERERLDRERALEAERERLRIENEQLAKEAAAAQAREKEARQREEFIRLEKEKAEQEVARQEAERLAEQRRLEEEAEAKRLAPDKDKILMFLSEIEAVSVPEISEEKARSLILEFEMERTGIIERFRARVKNL